MKLLMLAVLVLAGTVTADITYDVDLEQHMIQLSNPRYPIESNKNNRESAKRYIAERLGYYGLDVEEQKFNTTIKLDPYNIKDDLISVEGSNIIGIKRAVTEHPGAVIVVGADYDSNGVSNPLLHNGAGVAALLEAARLYSINEAWSGRYVANYTTIFVAFDINTKLHQGSPGQPGSHFFVQDWLMRFTKNNTNNFGGAIILDSIMNVNYEDNTQTVGGEFQKMFPETFDRIKNGGNKGDFLAMVSWGDKEASLKLKDQFSGSYYKGRRAERYRLEDMNLQNSVKFDNMVETFTKSSNIHFWTAMVNEKTVFMPALLLTDTKDFRTAVSTSSCVRDPCRPADLLTEERVEFVKTTVKAITEFLFSRQATLLPPQPASAMSSLPSAIMTGLMLCLVRLYM